MPTAGANDRCMRPIQRQEKYHQAVVSLQKEPAEELFWLRELVLVLGSSSSTAEPSAATAMSMTPPPCSPGARRQAPCRGQGPTLPNISSW